MTLSRDEDLVYFTIKYLNLTFELECVEVPLVEFNTPDLCVQH